MQRPLRVLAAPALLLLFAIAAQAGTQTAPEVTDPAQDQLGPGGTPGCAQGQCPIAGTRVDIVAALTLQVMDIEAVYVVPPEANDAE
jgi:hypothetical protein